MTLIKIRPALSGLTLEESLQRAYAIVDRATLLEYLQEHFHFWQPTNDNITIEPWGYDDRCGWDTHLICVAGKAAVYSSGPVPGLSPASGVL